MVRKLKLLKKPKFDLTKLMELYQDRPEDAKKQVGGDKKEEPSNLLTGAAAKKWETAQKHDYS